MKAYDTHTTTHRILQMAKQTYLQNMTLTSLTKYAYTIEMSIHNILTDQLRNYTRKGTTELERLERLAELVQEQIDEKVLEKSRK